MFIIGIIVYFGGTQKFANDERHCGVLFGRFVLSPLVVWLLSRIIPVPELMLSVFIIQASMPVQNSVPILVRNYQGDEEFATSCLGYSVLLYMVYLPVLLLF